MDMRRLNSCNAASETEELSFSCDLILIHWNVLKFLFIYLFLVCGILVLPPRIEPRPIAVQVLSSNHWLPGNSGSERLPTIVSVCLQCGRPGFDPWIGKIPWRRKWQPTPVLLPEKVHGRRSLIGYSLWGRKESDTTERLTCSTTNLLLTLSNRLSKTSRQHVFSNPQENL